MAEAAPAKAGAQPFGKGFIADAWYFVALGRDVAPAGLKRYEIMGEPVLIGRTRAGQVYAMRDICPHRAAPLSAGRLVEKPGEGETVECPYHGWRFPARRGLRRHSVAGRGAGVRGEPHPRAVLSGARKPGDRLRLDGV